MVDDPLDVFFDSVSSRTHTSPRRLVRTVRAAYPIGVPALILKSSTDRYGAAAGYAFHLGTPDVNLRRITSWLITNAGAKQENLIKLIGLLWKRHGREDVALAALLLANLDHNHLGTNPWDELEKHISRKEPAEALLLSIEEILRAGKQMPDKDKIRIWCQGKAIYGHLALMVLHADSVRGGRSSEGLEADIQAVNVPPGDSLLGRIKARLVTP